MVARDAIYRHINGGIGQRRAAKARQIDFHHAMMCGAQRLGHLRGSGEFSVMALAVVQ